MAAEAKKAEAKKEKKTKASAEEATAAAPKPPPPPRQPSDPRLNLVKSLRSKLLPRGDLRDRYKDVMQRWESGDHGRVTVEELQSLFDDRKSMRENRSRIRKA